MGTAGRPLKFKSKEDLEVKIDLYFAETDIKDWTITGLALALDTSRQTLLEYEGEVEGREEKSKIFADTIKKAKLMVEHSYELDLKHKGNTGSIFALKNFDWKDKQELDHTTKGKEIGNVPAPLVLEYEEKARQHYARQSQHHSVDTEAPDKD